MHSATTYIRALELGFYAKYLQSLGYENYQSLISQTGIDSDTAVKSDGFIDYEKRCLLFELTSEKLNVADFGARFALQMPSHMPQIGPVTYLRYFSKTMMDWFTLGTRYLKLHTNALELQLVLEEETDLAKLRVHMEPKMLKYHQSLDYLCVILLRLVNEHVESEHS